MTKSNLLHDRVHDPNNNYTTKNKKVLTGVSVWNDLPEYNIYGVVDSIEISHSQTGISKFCVVEYKPTQPQSINYSDTDALQVFAQKLCVDYTFNCDSSAMIYYANTKKRVELPFNTEFEKYDNKLKNVIGSIRKNLQSGTIPPIIKGQKCSGCSFKDICLPKIKKPTKVQTYIIKNLENEL